MNKQNHIIITVLFILTFSLAACGSYELKNIAKSDVDMVTDEFIEESRRLVRFRGLSNVRDANGDSQVVDIKYEYLSAL